MADADLEALLGVQALDLSIDQLRHRRATLPARASLADADAAIVELDASLGGVGGRAAELARTSKRLEDEIASLEAKAGDDERTLYGGTVNAPRELRALQEEIEGLRRRARHLEDELLEVMEQAEPVDAEVDRLDAERRAQLARREQAEADVAAGEREIDAELDAVTAERAAAVAGVPADLVATYERLRARLGGIGVARLDGNRCTGCHLTLPATEVDSVKRAAPGTVLFHEECGRILVPSR